MTNFCHLAPTPHLDDFCHNRPTHLLLAHLVEENEQYCEWFLREKERNPTTTFILDNSGYEQYRRGLPMFPSEKLIDLGKKIKADYIVMSDYPGQPSSATIASAEELAPLFKSEGFGTFYCPQSRIGDLDDYVSAVQWAADNPSLVDYIGISILGVPNAYGVEQGNKLQRFVSRWAMMNELKIAGTLDQIKNNDQKIHFLGLTDGFKEISLVSGFREYIHTFDSSAAIWYGLNGIAFDNSPTGSLTGKFEKEVDFNFSTNDPNLIEIARSNIRLIDQLCE